MDNVIQLAENTKGCCGGQKQCSKSDSLLYIGGFSPETVETMTVFRQKFVNLARAIEELGNSRELATAFTAIEHAQMLTIKHICLAAPEGVKEEV